MKIPVIVSLFIAFLCIIEYIKNYELTKHHTKIIYRYYHLFQSLQWILIAIMNAINSLLLIPIVIVAIFIHIKLSKAVHDNNFKE
jgi:hypothetical protein